MLNNIKMVKSNLRYDDIRCSSILTDFIIDNFYKKICDSFEIVLDKDRQIQGIDSIFKLNDELYICDEKSAIRYANKNLQTFSIELCFINKTDNLNVGWFLNDKNINNSYLFIWIDKAIVNEFNLFKSIDDLKKVEIALVKKDKIRKYLDDLGWNKENLLKKCERILENEHENLTSKDFPDIKFSFSKKLVEKPVNILIKRNKLLELSDFKLLINKDETSNT